MSTLGRFDFRSGEANQCCYSSSAGPVKPLTESCWASQHETQHEMQQDACSL